MGLMREVTIDVASGGKGGDDERALIIHSRAMRETTARSRKPRGRRDRRST